ncbi:MAG: hypothetical protein HC780_29480 [Leptolyngbyaceae cyanobacterium CSU_1_3]|nr:hypothetical protein [Leptolyngbyaceae cyanobacterium CSU_1_3]
MFIPRTTRKQNQYGAFAGKAVRRKLDMNMAARDCLDLAFFSSHYLDNEGENRTEHTLHGDAAAIKALCVGCPLWCGFVRGRIGSATAAHVNLVFGAGMCETLHCNQRSEECATNDGYSKGLI